MPQAMKNDVSFLLKPIFAAFFISLLIIAGMYLKIGLDLKDLTRDLTIYNLVIEGKEIKLTEGSINNKISDKVKEKTLRLAAFYQWNKEDPLFYSPDLDLPGLMRSVALLGEQDFFVRDNLKRPKSAYPFKFLKKLIDTASLTEEFFESPSDISANSLIEKQFETAQTYKEEAQSLLSILSPKDIPSPVIFNVKTSPQVIVSDLNKIIQNADTLSQEIEKRKSCLNGDGKCERPYKHFLPPEETYHPSRPPRFLDKKIIFSFSNNPNLDQIKGPYAAKTNCYGWGKDFSYPNHYFYISYSDLKNNNLKAPLANVQLATDLYFRRLTEKSVAPGDIVLIKKGIKYAFVSSTTPYDCQYFGNIAEVAEIDKFKSEKKPLLKELSLKDKDKETYNNALKQESDFFNSAYPSFDALSSLADHYGYIYRLTLESPGSEIAKVLKKDKEELLKRYLSIKRKLGNIDKIINTSAYYIYGFRSLELNPYSQFFSKTLYYPYRNFYGLLYFPFSNSFWRGEDNLSYFERTIVRGAVGTEKNAGYMTYTQALEKYSKEEVTQWLNTKTQIIEAAIEKKKKKEYY